MKILLKTIGVIMIMLSIFDNLIIKQGVGNEFLIIGLLYVILAINFTKYKIIKIEQIELIESKFKELEDITINNDYVMEKVTDLKIEVMETISTIHNSDYNAIKKAYNRKTL